MDKILFTSSEGSILTNIKGEVLEVETEEGGDLDQITLVDIDELKSYLQELGIDLGLTYDILCVGYWTRDGKYTEPETEYRDYIYLK